MIKHEVRSQSYVMKENNKKNGTQRKISRKENGTHCTCFIF